MAVKQFILEVKPIPLHAMDSVVCRRLKRNLNQDQSIYASRATVFPHRPRLCLLADLV